MSSTSPVKLVLIGNASVGKSSLLRKFSNTRWSLEDQEIPITLGSDMKVHNILVKGKRMKLCIWDTAGAEQFHALTSSYCRDAHGALLVYDISNRKSFEQLALWSSLLEKNALDSVVKIIVGNKADDESSRQVSIAEAEAFARDTNSLFIEASAKTAVGVSEAFKTLAEKIIDTPGLWDEEPRSRHPNSPPLRLTAQTEEEAKSIWARCWC